jgi:hypothetical protein
MINRRFITSDELEKIFYLLSNNIDWKFLNQGKIKFEKGLKSYSNNHWLLCIEQIWFNMTNIIHALMLN